MTSELFIENLPVDINASLSSLLTFAIDDVKDFASRQTAFSKTITLPGTAKNNRLFGNIFETGISNSYTGLADNIGYNFNASRSARCVLFQDNLQTFKGTMRLLQINKDRGNIEYEVALNGELTNLTVALSSAYLDELDFSAYDQDYTEANIVDSWDNPGGSGIYYPLIDYGNYSLLKHDWNYKTFRPALYVKEYIDKMFEAASYRYESALFETPRFKGLIVPHNYKQLTKLANTLFSGVFDSRLGQQIFFDATTTIFTPAGVADEWTFTGSTALTVKMIYSFSGTASVYNPTLINDIRLSKNGVDLLVYSSPSAAPFTWSGSIIITFNPGDTFKWAEIHTGSQRINIASASFSIGSSASVPVPILLGNSIPINEILPKNIKQIDFLRSIIKLFNLYVYESRFDDRLIYITPFVDFYSTDSANAVNWTYKLNRDQVVKVKPMSELNSKTYNFRYKDDSDYFNDLYKKRYNQGYGSYVFDSEFEFTSANSDVELIFASTPLVGYPGEDKVYPTIYKRSGPDTAPVEENMDSVIRILQTKKVTGVTSWDILDGATVLVSLTDYGYAGHFDDPDNPTNDLNFGVLKELFFTLVTGDLTVTQFNVYWSSYMAEICDKDSKMLIGKFYLNPKDIFDLDFSKYVYLDAVLFRLNKITDYNASVPNDCECELLKVINTLY